MLDQDEDLRERRTAGVRNSAAIATPAGLPPTAGPYSRAFMDQLAEASFEFC
jgi:hypothetical protein